MENAQCWSVTYTKHVKQKRKVYQDGFLLLQSSRHKVMLYDEWEKLLESRFVKKDDVINSGETLAFDSYLVDIGEPCGGHMPTSNLNWQEKDRKLGKKSGSLYRYDSASNSTSVDRTPTFRKRKERVINLSPSEKLIKDFKKTEMNKYVSSPSCRDMTKTCTEWQVLYTTQITKKAKTFHDGFLQLVVCGSQGRQVMLYDTTKRQLDSRFLKKDERVCSGESLTFAGHLVEIGEQEGNHKPITDSTPQGKDWKVVAKNDVTDHQANIPANKKFHAGNTPDRSSPGKLTCLKDASYKVEDAKLSWRTAVNEPKRAVHDILSIIRKPIQGKVVTLSKPSLEGCLESHSSDAHSDLKNNIKDHAEECSGSTREELREKTSGHDGKIEVLKPEAVEVLVAAEKCTVSGNGRECKVRSSTFCVRSGATNCIAPILNIECSNNNNLVSSASPEEPHTLDTSVSDPDQMRIESATPSRSKDIQESEKPLEIFSCEDIITETKAAAINGLSSSKSPKYLEDSKGSGSGCSEAASSSIAVASNDDKSHDPSGVEEKISKQDFQTKAMNEFPSFDLAF